MIVKMLFAVSIMLAAATLYLLVQPDVDALATGLEKMAAFLLGLGAICFASAGFALRGRNANG
ncbi:MAG: hypothetical protein GC147_00940 [Porphyrobacter sp.]|nr:hypothetical protein [Porphyrobacter sp.]